MRLLILSVQSLLLFALLQHRWRCGWPTLRTPPLYQPCGNSDPPCISIHKKDASAYQWLWTISSRSPGWVLVSLCHKTMLSTILRQWYFYQEFNAQNEMFALLLLVLKISLVQGLNNINTNERFLGHREKKHNTERYHLSQSQ